MANAFPAELNDLRDWTELSYELRLTDGLPVAPPLVDVVEALVAGSGRSARTISWRSSPPATAGRRQLKIGASRRGDRRAAAWTVPVIVSLRGDERTGTRPSRAAPDHSSVLAIGDCFRG